MFRTLLVPALVALGLTGCELNRDPNAWNFLYLGWKGSLDYSSGSVPRILESRLRTCMEFWQIPQDALVIQRNSGTAYFEIRTPDPTPEPDGDFRFTQYFFIWPGEEQSFYTITAIQGFESAREATFYEYAIPNARYTKAIRAVIRGLKQSKFQPSDCPVVG